MKIRSLKLLSGLFLISILVQNAQAQKDKIQFEYLTTNEGLSSNNIRCIFKDHDDFMWFGTDKGLNKYNGRDVEKFNSITNDSTTLLDDKIIFVFEDHLERLWVGTALGINLVDKRKNTFKRFPLPKENFSERNEIIGIVETESNSILVIAESALYEFTEKNAYKKLISAQDFPDFSLISCYAYHNGSLYIGTWVGHLFKYSIKTKKVVQTSLSSSVGFDNEPVQSIYLDNESFLISIGNKGVYQFKIDTLNSFKQVFVGSKEGSNQVYYIQKDHLNNYWLATQYGTVHLDNNFNLIHYFTNTFQNTSVNNNRGVLIYIDNTNIVWIGTRLGGVNKYDPNKIKFPISFSIINESTTEKARAVKCFYQDKSGVIWIGGDFGLHKFSKDEHHLQSWSLEMLYKTHSGIGGIASIQEASNNKLWLGNWGGGLTLFDPTAGTNLSYGPYLKGITGNGNCIMNMFRKEEILYMFTFNGIVKFNTQTHEVKWYRHNPADSLTLSNNSINSYCIADNENFWVGTENGLNLFNIKTEKFTRYFHHRDNTHSIASNTICSLLKDSSGNIWIGTSNGLSEYNQHKKDFTQSAFMEVNKQKIYSIEEASNNCLWISNGVGLVKFDLKNALHKVYNAQDGIKPMLEYSYRGQDGKLFFGGVNGVSSFTPENIINNNAIPRVIITQFKLFNNQDTNALKSVLEHNVTYTNEITLKHNQSSFSLEYSALNYTLPEKNKFKYILKGFDSEWTYSGITEQASYANVPPGNYTFIVLGSNNDGVWNTDGAKLNITIHSPWYWSAWSKALYIVILLLIILFIYRFLLYRQRLRHALELERIGRQQEEEKFQERFNFFTNVSHQIRTPLTLISGSVEQIKDELVKNPNVLKRLETVSRNTGKLLNLVNQLIDIKSFNTEKFPQLSKINIVDTLKELQLNYADIAQSKNIELIVDTQIDSLNVYIDKDKLDKILNNLIHNALKFTPSLGKVIVRLETLNDLLKVQVIDTGIGIADNDIPNLFRRFWRAKQQKGDIGGIGLSYTKDLVAAMQGKISVDSVVGQGATFTMEFPNALIIPEEEAQSIQILEDDEPIIENGKNKVLIVEDNDEMRHFIREALETKYSVDSEKDALGALNAIKKFNPDIIISDVMMAGMDGVTFCKEVKSNMLTSHIPVILLTADVLEESVISGYDSGADDYITKPFSIKLLLKRVGNLIESRKTLRNKYVQEMFPDLKELTASSRDEDFIKNAISIVEKNFGDSDFDSIKFSQEMAVSRTLLYTKLKSITGQSVNEFIRTIRLKKAAWLLINSDKQISDIAFTIGFSNAAYFSKCFTDQFGVSPRKYAEQNRIDK